MPGMGPSPKAVTRWTTVHQGEACVNVRAAPSPLRPIGPTLRKVRNRRRGFALNPKP